MENALRDFLDIPKHDEARALAIHFLHRISNFLSSASAFLGVYHGEGFLSPM
jgi:hypothetical protein